MELGVAHVTKVPEQVSAHAEDDVPERALLAAVPELAELVAHELLVVEVGVGGAAWRLPLEHPRGVRPLLVGERGAHHVPPELAAVGGLHPRAHPGAAPVAAQQERDGADGKQDPPRVVARVQPGRRQGRRGPQRGGEAVTQARQRAAEEHAQRERAPRRRGRADRERPHARLVGDDVHSDGQTDSVAGEVTGSPPRPWIGAGTSEGTRNNKRRAAGLGCTHLRARAWRAGIWEWSRRRGSKKKRTS